MRAKARGTIWPPALPGRQRAKSDAAAKAAATTRAAFYGDRLRGHESRPAFLPGRAGGQFVKCAFAHDEKAQREPKSMLFLSVVARRRALDDSDRFANDGRCGPSPGLRPPSPRRAGRGATRPRVGVSGGVSESRGLATSSDLSVLRGAAVSRCADASRPMEVPSTALGPPFDLRSCRASVHTPDQAIPHPGRRKTYSIPPAVVWSGRSFIALTKPRAAVPSRGSRLPETIAPAQPPTPARIATYCLPSRPR
jgi:hypothetical protein